jgi:hypothetical protein
MTMIVSVLQPERPFADLTDITTKEITSRGYEEDEAGQEFFVIRFAVNLTDDERHRIETRLLTSSGVEESLTLQSEAALETNRTFTNTTSPEIEIGANVILNDTSITTADVPGYLKDLARGVKTLNAQAAAAAKQRNQLIRLMLKMLDAED